MQSSDADPVKPLAPPKVPPKKPGTVKGQERFVIVLAKTRHAVALHVAEMVTLEPAVQLILAVPPLIWGALPETEQKAEPSADTILVPEPTSTSQLALKSALVNGTPAISPALGAVQDDSAMDMTSLVVPYPQTPGAGSLCVEPSQAMTGPP